MTMNDNYIKALMKTLETRRMRTAIETVTDDGEPYDKPVLIRVVIAGKHRLIHPKNFVEALGELEQIIDPTTLEIIDYSNLISVEDLINWGISEETIEKIFPGPTEQPPEPTTAIAEAVPETKVATPIEEPPIGTPPDTTTPIVEESKEQVWSEAELIVIGKQDGGYSKLRAISKLYDDIPGNISKAALIEKISGKAKP